LYSREPSTSAWPPPNAGTPVIDERTWVLLLCAAQVLLWSLAFGLTYSAPELDGAEQFVWSFSLENGYWKHPPMPSWIMHALIRVFGASVALPFVATQTSIVIALALTWRLGCEFMSARRSLIAMALTSLVTYHNIGGDCFNHNTALLPFQAATLLAFHRATRVGAWHQWALAGLLAGLAMLVKYVAALPLIGMLAYFALDRSLHTRRQLTGLAIASAVFVLTMLPHVIWLERTDFLPFRYARSVAQSLPGIAQTAADLAMFLVMQALRLLPFACGVWFALRRQPQAGRADLEAATEPEPRDKLFLWVAAVSLLLLTVAIGLLSQTQMQSRWGANAFLLSGWAVMSSVRRIDTGRAFKRAVCFAAGAHLVLCLGLTLSKTVVAKKLGIRTRANFPGAVLARNAHETWKRHTQDRLRIVVSDIWLGGNIIANGEDRVAVLIDGHYVKSPWVRESAVRDCGALVLDDQTNASAGHVQADAALDPLMRRADFTGTWELPWADNNAKVRSGRSGQVRWGIILPRSAANCHLK
jgi:4-amino-4-deoxy-L-arabinose transferase-like glycosyltransferase